MRRIAITFASGVLSLLMVLATMQLVCFVLNRVFSYHGHKYDVIWLIHDKSH